VQLVRSGGKAALAVDGVNDQQGVKRQPHVLDLPVS
jgi:hypothetical protein